MCEWGQKASSLFSPPLPFKVEQLLNSIFFLSPSAQNVMVNTFFSSVMEPNFHYSIESIHNFGSTQAPANASHFFYCIPVIVFVL